MPVKKRSTRGEKLLFIILSLVLAVTSTLFLINWEDYLQKGLDLEGGVYVLLEAQEEGEEEVDRDALQRAMTIIRSRVDELGVTEPVIQREGDRRIRIELPGVEDQAQALETIGRTAMLNFESPDGETILTGEDLDTARFTRGAYNDPLVELEFDAEGREKFAQATQEHMGEVISIYLDDELVSAPVVQEVITEGNAVISGIESRDEAVHVALMLRSGALPVELTELETRSVGPSLGENALNLSFSAGIIGLFLVMLYMLFYYRLAGVVAVTSLLVYLALVFLIMAAFNATITLPGLAGLILSIGLAVDANVLIFERVKEELGKGRTTLAAVNAGFNRALRAIIDANITTVIAAAVLFFVASGPVRGFALVLLIGIFCSVLSAILLTRWLMRVAARARFVRSAAGYLGYKEV